MAKLTKHYRALDHVIVALDSLSKAKPVTAAAQLQKAQACGDYQEMIQALDNANEPTTARPTLAQALTIVAAKSKDAKKKKMVKKKKAKASTGLVIAELEVENLDLTEDDLLDEGDDVEADVDTEGDDEDLDLDSLELDEGDDEGEEEVDAGGEDLDLGEEDEDLEMPEATSAEALGTDDEIKPGSEGAPKTTDAGEPSTTVKKEAVPAPSTGPSTAEAKAIQAATTKAAQRLLANMQVLETQSAKIKPVAKKVVKK